MANETELEKCNFQNFRSPATLTMDQVTRHTVVHQSSTSIYTPYFTETGKKHFVAGQMDRRTSIPTDGWTFQPLMSLDRLAGVDLKTQN